ncbi:MAG: hypothetical protein ABSG01_03690 [Anaerolineales bacterium]
MNKGRVIGYFELVARAAEIIKRECTSIGDLISQIDDRLVEVIDLLFTCRGHVLVT